jgi:hypothetical protein
MASQEVVNLVDLPDLDLFGRIVHARDDHSARPARESRQIGGFDASGRSWRRHRYSRHLGRQLRLDLMDIVGSRTEPRPKTLQESR